MLKRLILIAASLIATGVALPARAGDISWSTTVAAPLNGYVVSTTASHGYPIYQASPPVFYSQPYVVVAPRCEPRYGRHEWQEHRGWHEGGYWQERRHDHDRHGDRDHDHGDRNDRGWERHEGWRESPYRRSP